eukprot:scaffold1605_cov63-Phaeocystis_antarctica.AAC.4
MGPTAPLVKLHQRFPTAGPTFHLPARKSSLSLPRLELAQTCSSRFSTSAARGLGLGGFGWTPRMRGRGGNSAQSEYLRLTGECGHIRITNLRRTCQRCFNPPDSNLRKLGGKRNACKLSPALAPTGHGLRRRASHRRASQPLTCQAGPRAVGWPVAPQISMVGTGAGEEKLRPVLLAIAGVTATSAGIVARVSGLSTSSVGGVVGLGGFAITATSLMKWWQERDGTL